MIIDKDFKKIGTNKDLPVSKVRLIDDKEKPGIIALLKERGLEGCVSFWD